MDVSKLAITGSCLMIISNINKEDPTTIFYVRIGFAVITLLTYAIQFYVRSQIVKVNNKTEFTCKESELTPPNPYGASDATPEDKDVTMTTADYDLDQWKKGVTATIFPTCFILVLHFYFGFLPPLIFSPVNGFYDMFSQPLVRVYLLKEVKEDLAKRPFVKPKQEGFMDMIKKFTEDPADAKKAAITEKKSSTAKKSD